MTLFIHAISLICMAVFLPASVLAALAGIVGSDQAFDKDFIAGYSPTSGFTGLEQDRACRGQLLQRIPCPGGQRFSLGRRCIRPNTWIMTGHSTGNRKRCPKTGNQPMEY
jgi:hypothetical protein